MEYEIDYEHVIDREINGVNVSIYFSKKGMKKLRIWF